MSVRFDDETESRPVDDGLLAKSRGADGLFEVLPSLELKPPFDAFEAEFVERDPVTQLIAARESMRMRQAQGALPAPPTASFGSEPPPPEGGSGARPRPREDVDASARFARESSGPQPRPPHEAMPLPAPPFVMGVQPLRTLSPAAPLYASHAPPPPLQGYPHGMPMAPMIPPMAAAQPEQTASNAGRFAWFVFGAAFGIAFAFFATGLVPRLAGAAGPKEEAAATPITPAAPSAAATNARASTNAPLTTPPVAAPPPPVLMTVSSPGALPAARPQAPAPPTVFASRPAQPPPVSTPQRTRSASRRGSSAGTAPRPLNGGGGDGVPAESGGGDVNDILGNALRP